jgi:hypothetical protein
MKNALKGKEIEIESGQDCNMYMPSRYDYYMHYAFEERERYDRYYAFEARKCCGKLYEKETHLLIRV